MAKDPNVKNKKHFFKDFKAELKKVIWPTPKQIVNNTIAVITIVIITAVIVFALDSIFKLLSDKGLDRVKEGIRGNAQQIEATETSEEASENSEQSTTNNGEETSTENTVNN